MTEPNPGNTGDTPTFQESLGEHSSNELFAGIEDVGGLAGKFIEINTNLTEAQANAPVVPESMDDYAFDVVEGAIPYEDGNLATIKQFAHENKWSAETFNQALQIDQEVTKQSVDAHNAKVEEAQTALKAEMGDDYEPGVELVKKVLGKFGAEGLQERADDLASDPDIFRLVHAFGKVISPDWLEGSGTGGGGGGAEKSAADVLFNGK
ncbi:MAG: hypothetical protein KAV87_02395 [Desulfobacteraceae bacterium]|nr:hypothetical protein [Desulfobacteraceae bacterium]